MCEGTLITWAKRGYLVPVKVGNKNRYAMSDIRRIQHGNRSETVTEYCKRNSRHWKMPVKCPTSVVCHSIKVSKQTIITAREALRNRGLIRYTKGNGNGNSDAPGYTIITDPREWTDELTIIKTENKLKRS